MLFPSFSELMTPSLYQSFDVTPQSAQAEHAIQPEASSKLLNHLAFEGTVGTCANKAPARKQRTAVRIRNLITHLLIFGLRSLILRSRFYSILTSPVFEALLLWQVVSQAVSSKRNNSFFC